MKSEQKSILIAATSDLSTDQRVLKVADTFRRNGWQAFLIGRKRAGSPHFNTSYRHQQLRLLFNKSMLFYLEFNLRLFLKLLTYKYDYIYCNDTDTLLACFTASRIRKKPLFFDAHELFPELPELQGRRFVKKVWQTIEDILIPRLDRTITVCQSIADYYRERYGISMTVVRNVPLLRNEVDPLPLNVPKGKKVLLYQGALNTGRGLDWVIGAMAYISDAVLYIIGDGDIKSKLEEQVHQLNITDRVIFHGMVAANELHRYTPSADLGLCLLESLGKSYFYALPNRIFDYMHAGVPVLASPFPEIRNIVETYHTGTITDERHPQQLAAVISSLLQQPVDSEYLRTVAKEFCWESEEKNILKLI